MTQFPQTTIVVKPKPNIYTVLLLMSVLALGTTIAIVIWNLTSIYGLSFGEIFQPLKAAAGA